MACVLEACDPNTYGDVHGKLEWKNIVAEEYNSIWKTRWEMINQLQGNNAVKGWWVYKAKFTSKDLVKRYKACLIVKGFSWEEGITTLSCFP